MEFLRRLLEQLRQFWTRQSVASRILFASAAAIMLVAIVAVGFWAVQPEYSVLFSELPTEGAAEISTKLDADDVPYTLSDDGATILVPATRAPKLRMSLAMAGLPSGPGKGWELFDQSQFGMTPFQQNVAYQRAIQAELGRTIVQLDQVESAWVHIVQPDDTPFVREKKPVTASVVIKPTLGAALSRKQAEGIVALVAGSVKGLTADHVTVLDTQHRVLSQKSDPYEEMSSRQLEYQRDVESNLANKAEELLIQVLGPGRATVKVTADIDFKRVKENKEIYDPDGRVLLKESLRTLKTTQPETADVVGAAANVATSMYPASFQSSIGEKEEEEVESEYVISRTSRVSEKMQGIIKRLTIAVMITEDLAHAANGQLHHEIDQPQAEELVKQAVGFDAGRGDQIEVIKGRIVGQPPPKPTGDSAELQKWQKCMDILTAVSIGVALLAATAMYLLFRWKMQNRPEPEPEPEPPPRPTASLGNLESVADALKKWLDVT